MIYLKWDPLELLQQIQLNVGDAKDNLLLAKISQAYQANATRSPEIDLQVDEYVMLSMLHRRLPTQRKPSSGMILLTWINQVLLLPDMSRMRKMCLKIWKPEWDIG